MTRAAALIIGDEILTGKIRDENSFVLAKFLFEVGVDLERIVVIPDDVDLIAKKVAHLSANYDYVFTSGGIGPTHDDKTFEGVSRGLSLPLESQPEILGRLLAHAKSMDDMAQMVTKATKRMALVPKGCEILWVDSLWVPLVVVQNVYVLPGVPFYFKTMLESLRDRLQESPKERVLVYTQMREGEFADSLAEIQSRYTKVAIGSYPRLHESTYRVMIALEGRDRIAVQRAAEEVERAVHGFR